MVNIAVDYGNTTAKVGIFENDLVRKEQFSSPESLRKFLQNQPCENIIVSSVSIGQQEVLSWSMAVRKKIALTSKSSLPIKVLYDTPDTLGVDRIAAACGALDAFPGKDCLVVDAGTCINCEFLDKHGNYHGGSISPGIAMRFGAMHEFTSRLPQVEPVAEAPLIGSSTVSCMQSGVINGIQAEVSGVVARYRHQYPGIQVILCGGDLGYFETQLGTNVAVLQDLVLSGLNSILRFHTGTRT